MPTLRPILPLLFLLGACVVGGGSKECDVDAPGDLTVALGLPAGFGAAEPARVAVYDADGTEVGTLADGETLSGLPGGNYVYEVLRGWSDTAGGVRTAIGTRDAGVGEVCVGGNPTTLTLDLSVQPGSGMLWTTSWEHILLLPMDASVGTATPVADRALAYSNSFGGLAADRSGNLWAATAPTYGARLLMLTPGDLVGSGDATASVELSAPSISGDANLVGLVFDADGNAWAAAAPLLGGFEGVVGWSAATLREARLSGGLVEAEPTWAATVSGLEEVSGLTVDGDGELWVASSPDSSLARLPSGQLLGATAGVETPTAITPAVTVHLWDADHRFEWSGLGSLASDGAGGLYALARTSGAILDVPAGALAAGGEQTLDALDLGVTALPESLAADAGGGTWWSDSGRVGYLPAPGGTASLVSVEAIERAGAAWADVAP